MTDVTVIADDLTGAADCGIAFALAGLPTFVAIGNAPAQDVAQIVSVDADTRRLGEPDASARAGAVVGDAVRRGARALYKKIDSTLRGHVGAELLATIRAAGGEPLIVFAPAFPGTGRTTIGGQVIVAGVPLDRSEVWSRSGMAGPADPLTMLQNAGLHAESIALAAIRSGLQHALRDAAARGAQVAICDAESDDDLRRIAEAGAALGPRVIWSGSGGLARHLPAALRLRPLPRPAPPSRMRAGPILALVGSRSSVAREQARALGAEDGVSTVVLDPEALLGGAAAQGWARARAELRRGLAAGSDVLLLTGTGATVDPSTGPAVADAMGRFAAESIDGVGALVATGGDIARAVLAAIGASGLHLLGEVEPGVPIGIADSARPLPVVTKAGAFGRVDTLGRCREAVKRLMGEDGAAAPAGAGGF